MKRRFAHHETAIFSMWWNRSCVPTETVEDSLPATRGSEKSFVRSSPHGVAGLFRWRRDSASSTYRRTFPKSTSLLAEDIDSREVVVRSKTFSGSLLEFSAPSSRVLTTQIFTHGWCLTLAQGTRFSH